MPAKKQTAPKVAKVANSRTEKNDYKKLEEQIVALKKEIDALRGQCSNCCNDIAELKNAPEVELSDKRVDLLLDRIINSFDYRALKRYYKNKR